MQILGTDGFMPRTSCGPSWSSTLILVHELSNLAIFLCYMLIPFGCVGLYRRISTGGSVRNPKLGVVLSFGFILTCGLTHLMDRLMFQWPAYRLGGLVLAVCAAFSIATVAWMTQALGDQHGR